MQAERAPSRAISPSDVYRAYVGVLPKWLRRFKVSNADAADVMQEVWLAVCSGSIAVPQNIQEARLELFKVTRVVAQRLRRLQEREAYRLVPELDDNGRCFDVPMGRRALAHNVDEEEFAALTLGAFEAFERLSPDSQQLAREYYVLGYTIKEMAERAAVPEDRMEKWVWRVRAELEKIAQKDQRFEAREKKHQRGLLVVPFAFDFGPEIRAAFCSIWETEGECTALGGGGGHSPPLSMPPVKPGLSAMSSSVVAAVGWAILVVMLLIFPVGLMALHYFWPPPRVENTAQAGLHVPPLPTVGAIDDVMPAYPTNLPAAPPTQRATVKPARKSIPVDDDPSSGPAFERGATD